MFKKSNKLILVIALCVVAVGLLLIGEFSERNAINMRKAGKKEFKIEENVAMNKDNKSQEEGSSKRIIIQTQNVDDLKKYEGIEDIKNLSEGSYVVMFNSEESTKKCLDDLKNDNNIESAVSDYKIHASEENIEILSVPSNAVAWGVSSTAMNHYTSKLNFKESNQEIKVAVLDTGINYNHSAFTDQTKSDRLQLNLSKDYVNSDIDVQDDNGHGTAVAGCIVESTPQNVKIVPAKIMDENGDGYLSDMIAAIEDLYREVDVINLSLGMRDEDLPLEVKKYFDQYLRKATEHGTIVVCAAGNEGSSVSYPATSTYTLAAGAVNQNNEVTSFSNYGKEVDFTLPGEHLVLPYVNGENAYAYMSGTSFSCPFLASAVALVKNDGYTSQDKIVEVLKENAVDLGPSGKDDYYGYGSIDFDSFIFKNPVIASAKAGNEDEITISAVGANDIIGYSVTDTNNVPSKLTTVENPGESVVLKAKAKKVGTNYVWVKDRKNNVSKTTVDVKKLEQNTDTETPNVSNFYASEVTEKSFKLNINAQDGESGISKVVWHYKKSSEQAYKEYQEVINNEKGIARSYVVTNLADNTEYNCFADVYDAAGNKKTTNVINCKTAKRTYAININNKTSNMATVSVANISKTSNFTANSTEGVVQVSCQMPCVVIVSKDGIYSRVKGTKVSNNQYKFVFELNKDVNVIVALKGDVNLNGSVNITDSSLISRSRLSENEANYIKLNSLEQIMADVNANGSINITDASLISKSRLDKNNQSYKPLEW